MTRDHGNLVHKNKEQAAELAASISGRHKAETELERVTREFEEYRLKAVEERNADARDLSSLQNELRDVKSRFNAVE